MMIHVFSSVFKSNPILSFCTLSTNCGGRAENPKLDQTSGSAQIGENSKNSLFSHRTESCGLCEKQHRSGKIISRSTFGYSKRKEGIERFEGIVSKSNFDSKYTDLSPAFNFENFLKKIENEQLV